MTRGATNRRSGSGRIAPYQARRFAPPIVVAAPAIVMTTPMLTIATGDGRIPGPGQERQPGEDEPAGLADEQDRDGDPAQVAVEPPEQPWDEQLGGRERVRQDADDRRQRRMRAEGQQQRDRQPVAGQRRDRGLADPDPEEPAVALAEEEPPFVDRGVHAAGGRVGHQLPIAGPYQTLAAMIR